jgi:ferredoxin-NADP reductase
MSQVKKYRAEVVSLSNPIDNIYTVEFCSLSGRFKYHPGQFLHLALDEYDPSFGWPESRCFSIQTPPEDKCLKLTFAVKGNFTNRMAAELSIGRIIDLKLPYGTLIQHENPLINAVFIAGGTGITPFLSIINDSSFSKYINPKLYLGVREPKYNIYMNELNLALTLNHSLSVEIVSQSTHGVLNIIHIFENSYSDSTYIISGPQQMISTFRKALLLKGIPEQKIITDDWE